MNFLSYYDTYLIFIVIIKVLFIFSALGYFYYSSFSNSSFSNSSTPDVTTLEFQLWKERTEFVFIVSMAILLIYHFKPGHLKPISSETTLLFFLFGWILIFTAKWSLFFTEAKWYKNIVYYLQ
jgi:hypothetical protein